MKRRRVLSSACGVFALCALLSCRSTLDSLGGELDSVDAGGGSESGGASSEAGNDAGASDAGASDALPTPVPLTPLTSYPNAFRDLLGQTDDAIASKLDKAFTQLFYGDADNQAIYVKVGDDRAYIHDVLHDDIRTEGSGIGMIITVELGKKEEFDRLWTYAKASLQETTGPATGYFKSICDDDTVCYDPYGMEQMATALLFAHDRWGSTSATPYGSEALKLIALLADKELDNGGVVNDITSVFDATTALPREQPALASSGYTRSSLQMPSVFELWAQATGDAFWHRAGQAASAGLLASADATTGLWPIRNYFDGKLVPGSDIYRSQGYRTQFNLALDTAWGGGSADHTDLANRVLAFFTAQGLTTYGGSYSTTGSVLDPTRDVALIAANGALAVAASASNRSKFVSAVWSMDIPTGQVRYYGGLLYLMSLMVLSGQYQVL